VPELDAAGLPEETECSRQFPASRRGNPTQPASGHHGVEFAWTPALIWDPLFRARPSENASSQGVALAAEKWVMARRADRRAAALGSVRTAPTSTSTFSHVRPGRGGPRSLALCARFTRPAELALQPRMDISSVPLLDGHPRRGPRPTVAPVDDAPPEATRSTDAVGSVEMFATSNENLGAGSAGTHARAARCRFLRTPVAERPSMREGLNKPPRGLHRGHVLGAGLGDRPSAVGPGWVFAILSSAGSACVVD